MNNISEAGYFDTYPTNNSASFNGAWSIYPYFASGNIIISDIEGGLFVVRKTGTLAIGDSVFNTPTISVYPNPASNILNISSTNEKINNIALFTILGQEILKLETNNRNQVNVDIEHLNEGVYVLKINNNYAKKVIIKR